MRTDRRMVYDAIDGERTYQNKWDTESDSHGIHELESFVYYMEDYMRELKTVLSRGSQQEVYPKGLNILRKIVALGVAAMEQHGAPKREGF